MDARTGRSSLRLQVVSSVGAVVVILMGVISLSVLLQARMQILEQETRSAEAVARAFAIPAVDAMIMGDQTGSAASDVLDNHIRTFIGGTEGVLAVGIVDPEGWVVAHSDPGRYNRLLADSVALRASRTTSPVSSVFQNDAGRWVIEVSVPLSVGSRWWGAALIQFDGEPARRQVQRLFLLLLLLTVVVTSATLGVLHGLIGRVTASLRALVSEMDRTDFETAAPVTLEAPDNEVGYLIHRFGLLKERLVLSRDQLARAQHQVYQAEKLASVGRLASGVAHEVNNPLNGIRFCLHGIQAQPGDAEQTERYLGLITEGIQQIESVVQKLLGFARSQPASFQAISLNEQLQVVLELLGFQTRQKAVAVQVALDPELPAVKADPTLMKEVFMNLLMNAIDAVDEGGTIRIQSGATEEGGVFVSIADNGVGILPEHLSQVFEPFFTTKETGRGTGLGLSVTLGIVELHKGTIRVHSVPGTKTTFTVALPTEVVT